MSFIFYSVILLLLLFKVCFQHDLTLAEPADVLIPDGPNEEGLMFERPGKLADAFPRPYSNREAAMAANNGAEPPDLSFIVRAREGMEDYIFALLTGYQEAPAGMELGEGQYYNPYFLGGAISMAEALYNEIIEYDDGTPATQSQLAKDVTIFLAWTAEMEFDDRKRIGLRTLFILGFLGIFAVYYNRHKWSFIRSRQFGFKKE